MAPEDVQNEIKLIFARACAESLKETASSILSIKEGGREEAAKAHGEAFASAFTYVLRHFNTACLSTRVSAVHTAQSSSTPEAGSQQSSALPGQP